MELKIFNTESKQYVDNWLINAQDGTPVELYIVSSKQTGKTRYLVNGLRADYNENLQYDELSTLSLQHLEVHAFLDGELIKNLTN